MDKGKRIFVASIASFFLMTNTLAYASETAETSIQDYGKDGLEIIYSYENDVDFEPDKDIVSGLSEEIEYEGKKYELNGYTDKVIKKTENLKTEVKADKKENLKEKTYEPSQTKEYTIDGETYTFKLSEVTYEKQSSESKKVTVTDEYINEKIPSEIETEFVDERTGDTIKAMLPYAKKEVVGTQWLDIEVPMTIYVYDAAYYDLNGTRFYKDANGNLDIKNKEAAILNYLGLNSERYHLSNVSWSGDAYNVNGELRRNAVARGQYLADIEKVTFEKDVELPQLYTSNATYKADVFDGTYTYTHQLTATYKLVNHTALYIAISVGVILAVILVVLILMILSKKEKKKMKKSCRNNHECGRITNRKN